MVLNYFDIETTGFNPTEDRIITIQYQGVYDNGNTRGDLVILREWESSEEEIVTHIWEKIKRVNDWKFIPLGTNLIFDLSFLWAKFQKYNLESPTLIEWLFRHPQLDIKATLVMINDMQFRGSGLNDMTNKKTNGKNIPIWYKEKKYNLIEDYIKQETKSFLEFFRMLADELPKLKMDKEGEEDKEKFYCIRCGAEMDEECFIASNKCSDCD